MSIGGIAEWDRTYSLELREDPVARVSTSGRLVVTVVESRQRGQVGLHVGCLQRGDDSLDLSLVSSIGGVCASFSVREIPLQASKGKEVDLQAWTAWGANLALDAWANSASYVSVTSN